MPPSRLTASDLIDRLCLVPLPGEGGFYRETYRSPWRVPAAAGAARAASTCIYYLLTPATYSALHTLASDEIYHFYTGDPVEMIVLAEDGSLRRLVLGSDLAASHHCQLMVPAHVWQGSRLLPGGEWALLGTTVAPGFEFADCRLADRALLEKHPRHAALLEEFLPRAD